MTYSRGKQAEVVFVALDLAGSDQMDTDLRPPSSPDMRWGNMLRFDCDHVDKRELKNLHDCEPAPVKARQ